ncbi:EamA family transporter [Paracoccus simplex]|uniref:EamA family transporter n=1 Tax=Paracoccus simplex TaxID=2086346 RepID=A0ABV7RWW7_9RHOB
MTKTSDVVLTATAPAVWGSTYIVATELLPDMSPLAVAAIRALPAGVLLLLVVRQLPAGIWLLRSFVLGALNFSIFWALLFVAAYRLPGGIAATVGAVQPLIVIFVAAAILGTRIRPLAITAAVAGIAGVALLVLRSEAALDPMGIAAAVAGAFSMAFGTVLTRKWQPPVSALTLTAWQLSAGGLLLMPVVLLAAPPMPAFTMANAIGSAYLVVFTALTYVLWFRGVARLDTTAVSSLGFLSPLTAILLGWAVLGQALSSLQFIGAVIVVVSIWISQRSARRSLAKTSSGSRSPKLAD